MSVTPEREGTDPVWVSDGQGAGLALAWVLSSLALLPAFAHMGVARTPLALLAWMLWAGWPQRDGSFLRRAIPALALMAPVLALTFELDRSSGLPPRLALHFALFGAVLAFLALAASAAAARVPGPGASAYASAWFASFLLVPLLAYVVGEGAPAWLSRVGAASPVAWAVGRIPPGDSRPAAFRSPEGNLPSLLLVLALWVAVILFARLGASGPGDDGGQR